MLACTHVLVEQALQDGCHQHLCPQGALQDQQVGLTEAPFKLLLMPWFLEHVRFVCSPFKSEVYFPWPSGSLEYKLYWPSQPKVLEAHLPSAELQGCKARCVA